MNKEKLQAGFESLINFAMDPEDCWAGRPAGADGETFNPPIPPSYLVPDIATQVVNFAHESDNVTYVKFANGQIARFEYRFLEEMETRRSIFENPDIKAAIDWDED